MDDLPSQIELWDCWHQASVDSTIIELNRELAASHIDGQWWNIPGVSATAKSLEGDHHWVWRKLVGSCRENLAWECLAIQTPDQSIQGAMIYRIDVNSFADSSLGIVFIDRIATAPRNRDWLVTRPRFEGVGTGLLLRAVCHSYQLGLAGRVGLVSLPSERTRAFYRRRGFVAFAEDDDGMIEYELSADAAQAWLEEEGLL